MAGDDKKSTNGDPNEKNEQNKQLGVGAEVARVAVKPPPFWCNDPLLWFKQMESQFFMAGVTQDTTKFHTIVASIESSILSKVNDIIINPPKTDMYETLKDRLINSFTDSEEKRLRRLLNDVEIGGKKPSEMLNEMRLLAQGKVSDDLLKQLWLPRLPSQTKAILAVSEDTLDKLALMADKIGDNIDSPEINAVATAPPTSRFDELERKIDSLTTQLQSFSRSRSSSRPNRPRNRSSSRKSKPLCWYHFKFGERARKCVEPCNFNSSSTTTTVSSAGN